MTVYAVLDEHNNVVNNTIFESVYTATKNCLFLSRLNPDKEYHVEFYDFISNINEIEDY